MLYSRANGTSLSFVTRSNAINLMVAINWSSNEWHQVTLTHDPTNSSIYVDGVPLATNGLGAFYFPDPSARSEEFTIGSTKAGVNQARGRFDELATLTEGYVHGALIHLWPVNQARVPLD
jgi:hypothetical protein